MNLNKREQKRRGIAEKKPEVRPEDFFAAARAGEVKAVRAYFDAGADPTSLNEYGFTALQCAAMGANQTGVAKNLAVLEALLEAGSPLEAAGRDGRTALYLAAEFAPSVDAVRLLLDAGAQADVCDRHGNHITTNAMMPEVKALLSRVTGRPAPSSAPPPPEPIKMKPEEWRAAKRRIDAVFDALSEQRLVALQDAGRTQSDGFSDCAEVSRESGGRDAGLHGFCFYTRQDLNRAKRTGQLALAFWGAPGGRPKDMERVGRLIVEVFRGHGFEVDWDGSGGTRPTVYLQDIGGR